MTSQAVPAPPEALPADAVCVGRIRDAWGIAGSIRVEPFNAPRESVLRSVRRWWLVRAPAPGGAPLQPGSAVRMVARALQITRCRIHGDALVAQAQRERVDGPEPRGGGGGGEARPPVGGGGEVGNRDLLPAVEAVEARTLGVLELGQLDEPRVLARGTDVLQAPVVVGQEHACGALTADVDGVGGDGVEELDEVEVVDQGVSDLDEHVGKALHSDHDLLNLQHQILARGLQIGRAHV